MYIIIYPIHAGLQDIWIGNDIGESINLIPESPFNGFGIYSAEMDTLCEKAIIRATTSVPYRKKYIN